MSDRPSPWGKYLHLARIGALNYLAHRATVVMILVIFIIEAVVHGYLWQAVFSGQQRLAGYDLRQMLTYVALAWALRAFFNNHSDREIGEQIRSGTIISALVLPYNFQLGKLSQIYGRALIRLLTTAGPFVLVMTTLFPLTPPASLLHALFFTITAGASVAIYASINFITGTAAFYTEGYLGISSVKSFLIGLLSGAFIPYALLPVRLQQVLGWLPFRGMADLPITLYLGKVGPSEGVRLVLFQLAWAALLFGLGQLYWRHASQHRFVEGG